MLLVPSEVKAESLEQSRNMPYKNKKPSCSSQEEVSRVRVPNWQHNEVMLLLEEIRLEGALLLSAHCADITNKKKEEVWEKISQKLCSSFGVANRTSLKCREKWGVLKAAAIKQAKQGAGAGEGHPKQCLPGDIYELAMAIIGENSTVVNGIQEGAQSLDQESREIDVNIEALEKPDPLPDDKPANLQQHVQNAVGVFACSAQPDQSIVNQDIQQLTVPATLAAGCTSEEPTAKVSIHSATRRLLHSRAKKMTSSAPFSSTPRLSRNTVCNAGIRDDPLFQEYLRSEIKKNEEKTIYLRKMSEKVSFEIMLLKRQLKSGHVLVEPLKRDRSDESDIEAETH